MPRFISSLFTCSLAMSIAALAIMLCGMLVRRFARTRSLSARVVRRGWIIVALGFACPVRPQFSHIVSLPPRAQSVVGAISTGIRTALPRIALNVNTNVNAQAVPISTAPSPAVQFSIHDALLAVWLCGAIAALAVGIVRHVRFRHTVLRWSEPAPNAVRALVSMRVRVLVSPAARTPMLIGLFRPIIVLPRADYPPDELQLILAHEQAHMEGGDIALKYLMLVVRAMHWFNPIMPAITREIELACEQSCDERTLASQSGQRMTYVSAILTSAVNQHTSPLTTDFSGGKHVMKRRISAMFKQKTRRMGALITLTALAITAIFPSFAALALEDSATAQPYSDEYTLCGGDSADDILHDIFALALTRVGDGQGDLPYAQLIIASDNVDDFIRYALDACARLEASADFDTAAAQMVEDHELGQWAVDTLRAAPEGFSVSRLLTAESDGLYAAILSLLERGSLDQQSILCAGWLYELAEADDARVDKAGALDAVTAWSRATGTNMFGILDGSTSAPIADADSASEESAAALDRILALALNSAAGDDDLQRARTIIATGDVEGTICAALPISGKNVSEQTSEDIRLMLRLASGEITPAMTQMLISGQSDAKGLLCAAWYSEIIDSSLNNMQTLPDGAERTALSETIVQMQSALETWHDISKLDIP